MRLSSLVVLVVAASSLVLGGCAAETDPNEPTTPTIESSVTEGTENDPTELAAERFDRSPTQLDRKHPEADRAWLERAARHVVPEPTH